MREYGNVQKTERNRSVKEVEPEYEKNEIKMHVRATV